MMDSETHQIDPDGDVVLHTPKFITNALFPLRFEDTSFLVSSKHLKLASPYFKSMLSDRWTEGKSLAADGVTKITIPECKPDTLEILLNLIHGHIRKVPRKLTLQGLSDISVATDFFQCHEIVEMFAAMWIKELKPTELPSWQSNSAMITQWIMISSVFKVNDILVSTIKLAMSEGTSPFSTLKLPIPTYIKDGIDNARERYLKDILFAMETRIMKVLLRITCVCATCDAACLGSMLQQLADLKISAQLLPPLLRVSTSIPLQGLSPSGISSMVLGTKRGHSCAGCRYQQHNPWGDDAERLAKNLEGSLRDVTVPPP